MDLAKNLRIECVSRLHPKAPLYLAPNHTVTDAVALMRREGVGCVLVCEGERLVGIFTERDLLRRILAPGKPLDVALSECMTPTPVAVRPKEPIAAAVRSMVSGGYRHLPVVDEDGRPIGVVSVKRIMHYLVEHFPATVYNLPPEPRAVPQEREGA